MTTIASETTRSATAVAPTEEMATSVLMVVSDRNIFPVTGKVIDGGRQYLFLRREVNAVLTEIMQNE